MTATGAVSGRARYLGGRILERMLLRCAEASTATRAGRASARMRSQRTWPAWNSFPSI